ncbi:hypothetical protein GO730_26565 [Spirosoma sp. HMF3257]|uniref:Uncharacterized protein n=1 Tax=Spirosoma telluris TaxID=2183553 RepID=A0A327NSP0_9BACT|nr:hypothetical protein [Spirosoma telluris]RAI76834.1 hypothetical protein HMF3257_26495 [Spirosoma telluris]
MNRADKLKALQDAFQGQYRLLHQLHREERKKIMPFLEVHGLVNIRSCSALLSDLLVMPTESIIDRKKNDYITLRDCLRRFDEVDPKGSYYSYNAIGSLDADSSQYDAVALNYIQIRHPNYSNTYLQGGTIADLRHYFKQSASAFDEHPFLLLSLETDLSRFEWYFKKAKTA